MAPELSVTEYCKMLADRGHVDKLENMNQLAFSQIANLVQHEQQQKMMAMVEQAKSGKEVPMDNVMQQQMAMNFQQQMMMMAQMQNFNNGNVDPNGQQMPQ